MEILVSVALLGLAVLFVGYSKFWSNIPGVRDKKLSGLPSVVDSAYEASRQRESGTPVTLPLVQLVLLVLLLTVSGVYFALYFEPGTRMYISTGVGLWMVAFAIFVLGIRHKLHINVEEKRLRNYFILGCLYFGPVLIIVPLLIGHTSGVLRVVILFVALATCAYVGVRFGTKSTVRKK
jgi:hypothetical protein